MKKIKPTPLTCKATSTPTLDALLSQCRSTRESRVLLNLWVYQGLLTHELSEKFGCKSNNHHNVTQALNPRLIRMGWVIAKYRTGQPNESWRWYLEPVHVALSKPIRKDLRETIIRCMEAANDE